MPAVLRKSRAQKHKPEYYLADAYAKHQQAVGLFHTAAKAFADADAAEAKKEEALLAKLVEARAERVRLQNQHDGTLDFVDAITQEPALPE
jgi:hypothetical protein